MRSKKLLTLTFLLITGITFAQDDDKNLVQNPGFETLDGRLRKEGQIEVAKYWWSPTDLEADLYSREVKEGVSVPDNNQGTEEPAEGDNYAGIRTFSYNDKMMRTYISTELLGGLRKGIEYCVSFKVSLSERSKYASNNITAHLSKKPLELEDKANLYLDKKDLQVRHSKNKIFNAHYNWETICTIVKADGGEKFLTIGNFESNKETKFDKMKRVKDIPGSQTYDAYYYIDDVQVFQLDSVAECNCEQKDISKDVVETVYVKQVISKKELKTPDLVEASTLYFYNNKSELTDVATKDLTTLSERMKAEPQLKLIVHGHSDKEEVEAGRANPLLKYMAQKRVNEVIKFMEEHGISKSRVVVKVHDDTMPADDSDTGIAQAKNRRVEFEIIE